jgi:hypothetical protein
MTAVFDNCTELHDRRRASIRIDGLSIGDDSSSIERGSVPARDANSLTSHRSPCCP